MGDEKRDTSLDRRFFRAMQRLTQIPRSRDATASDGDLKYRARHCHTLFVLQISSQAINLKYYQIFFLYFFLADFNRS